MDARFRPVWIGFGRLLLVLSQQKNDEIERNRKVNIEREKKS